MIRVLIADDQPLMRDAVAAVIDSDPGLQVVGQAADGAEAVRLARELIPDVVCLDIRMPGLDGIGATESIRADPALAETRVLILTTFEDDDNVARALAGGAAGFIGKGTDPDGLIRAIHTVHRGDALLSPVATRLLIDRVVARERRDGASRPAPDLRTLTAREVEVLGLVGRGWANTRIAVELHISPLTVKTHVARIMVKVHAHDRAQLVVAAYENGVV